MKIKSFLKFYLGYNSFQVVTESGDRWTDVLSKEEVLKSFGNAELKRTELNGEEYVCWMVFFICIFWIFGLLVSCIFSIQNNLV